MLIRCEKCRALFSLPDSIDARGGAGEGRSAALTVQCGRCETIFTLPGKGEPTHVPGSLPQQAKLPPGAKYIGPKQSRFAWHAPALLGLAVALLIVAFFAWRQRQPRLSKAASSRMAQGEKLLLKDDLQSLDQAAQLFTDAAHLSPRMALPEAQRALALLLQSSTRAQLQDPSSTKFLQQGVAAARTASREAPQDPAVLRAVAFAQVLSGEPQIAEKTLAAAGSDPWTQYVRSLIAPDPLPILETLKAQHLIRAEVDEARVLMGASPQRAKEILQQVLGENPKHEIALRLSK